MTIVVPTKVRWRINLQTPRGMLWSPSRLEDMRQVKYRQNIVAEWMPSSMIADLFIPYYEKLIVTKTAYHLDHATTIEKIRAMAHDPTYTLLWLRVAGTGEPLGGTICHILPHDFKVAYRAYDHVVSKNNHLRRVDYYADTLMQDRAIALGNTSLSHGTDSYPTTQLGLPAFKLSVGALPMEVVDKQVEMVEIDRFAQSMASGTSFLCFTHPVAGFYKQAILVNPVESDTVLSLTKLLKRAEIELVEMVVA